MEICTDSMEMLENIMSQENTINGNWKLTWAFIRKDRKSRTLKNYFIIGLLEIREN
jgi:hypothetical protein